MCRSHYLTRLHCLPPPLAVEKKAGHTGNTRGGILLVNGKFTKELQCEEPIISPCDLILDVQVVQLQAHYVRRFTRSNIKLCGHKNGSRDHP